MKRTLYSMLAVLLIGWTLNSCRDECVCFKDLGCTVLTVKKLKPPPADIVVTTRTFCSAIDLHSDWKLQDSINAFRTLYTTDSTYVNVKDSIYKHYEPVYVKGNLNRYTDSGYFCGCPR
jgi:hypothetical protein